MGAAGMNPDDVTQRHSEAKENSISPVADWRPLHGQRSNSDPRVRIQLYHLLPRLRGNESRHARHLPRHPREPGTGITADVTRAGRRRLRFNLVCPPSDDQVVIMAGVQIAPRSAISILTGPAEFAAPPNCGLAATIACCHWSKSPLAKEGLNPAACPHGDPVP